MRVVLQRVTRARVMIEGETVGEIARGIVVLLGIAQDDTKEDAKYLLEKIAALRIFDDMEGRMNLPVTEVDGALLIVSQFTLYGDARRGRRPSWSDAARRGLFLCTALKSSRRMTPRRSVGVGSSTGT